MVPCSICPSVSGLFQFFLLKRLTFPSRVFSSRSSNISWLYVQGLFLGSQFYYFVLCVHFYARTILFATTSLQCNLKSERIIFLVVFLLDCFIFEDFCGPIWSFPGGFDYKESACDVETRAQSLYQEDTLAKEWLSLEYSCLDNSRGRKPEITKSWTWLMLSLSLILSFFFFPYLFEKKKPLEFW